MAGKLVVILEEVVFKDIHAFVSTFYTVLTQGDRAFNPALFDQPATFNFSMRFLAYIALLVIPLHLPLAAISGLKYDTFPYISISWAALVVAWFMYSLTLHLGMKMVGGKGQLKNTLIVVFFLQAFAPIITLIQLPIKWYYVQAINLYPNASSFFILFPADVKFRVLLLFAIQIGVLGYVLLLVYRSLSKIHNTHGWRSVSGLSIGIIGVLLTSYFIVMPVNGMIEMAFRE